LHGGVTGTFVVAVALALVVALVVVGAVISPRRYSKAQFVLYFTPPLLVLVIAFFFSSSFFYFVINDTTSRHKSTPKSPNDCNIRYKYGGEYREPEAQEQTWFQELGRTTWTWAKQH